MDIATAEYKIAEILRDLERDSGQIVESISVRDVEVTNLHSTRPEWARCVNISMFRLPGTEWAVMPNNQFVSRLGKSD